MRYNFSTQFLKIQNPDTNFGEAWESLCFDLLRAEFKNCAFQRLAPPDEGIDILMKNDILTAIQCKSDERGEMGSLSSDSSINSLRTALKIKTILTWEKYIFATNANYTGSSTKKIFEVATELGLDKSIIDFWEAHYWSDLCEKHFELVKHRFDYRLMYSESEVIEAFRKARYYDNYISEYKEKIKNSGFTLKIKNNRTPLEIEFPFSPDLTVENCVDVVKTLLGISLDWTNYDDLGTSSGPSISLTINKFAQGFNKKIGELDYTDQDSLELWIKIIWRDELKDKGVDSTKFEYLKDIRYYKSMNLEKMIDLKYSEKFNRDTFDYEDRGKITIYRQEQIIQNSIWKNSFKN
jgi:hypothetical protein